MGLAQKHGHVWKANVLGAAIYGLAGDSGLKAFYDEENVKRFPGMSTNLEQAAWVLKVCKPQLSAFVLLKILSQTLLRQR